MKFIPGKLYRTRQPTTSLRGQANPDTPTPTDPKVVVDIPMGAILMHVEQDIRENKVKGGPPTIFLSFLWNDTMVWDRWWSLGRELELLYEGPVSQ